MTTQHLSQWDVLIHDMEQRLRHEKQQNLDLQVHVSSVLSSLNSEQRIYEAVHSGRIAPTPQAALVRFLYQTRLSRSRKQQQLEQTRHTALQAESSNFEALRERLQKASGGTASRNPLELQQIESSQVDPAVQIRLPPGLERHATVPQDQSRVEPPRPSEVPTSIFQAARASSPALQPEPEPQVEDRNDHSELLPNSRFFDLSPTSEAFEKGHQEAASSSPGPAISVSNGIGLSSPHGYAARGLPGPDGYEVLATFSL
jgi:hypothetical protein